MGLRDKIKSLKQASQQEANVEPENVLDTPGLPSEQIIAPKDVAEEVAETSSVSEAVHTSTTSLKLNKLKQSKVRLLNSSKAKLGGISTSVSARAKVSSQALREHAPELKSKLNDYSNSLVEKASEIKLSELTSSVSEQLNRASSFSKAKISDLTTKALHLDKNAEQIVEEIKHKSPPELDNVDDILSHCKHETIKSVLTSFALHDATMQKYDEKLADNFSNLSETYANFDERVSGVRNHSNFEHMKSVKREYANSATLIQDEYQSSRYMDADRNVHIDHVISTSQIFDDVLLKASTSDSELVDIMNNDENLAFTFSSLNTSKNDHDFAAYLKDRATPHPTNEDLVIVVIAGNEVTVNKKEALAKYESAQEAHKQQKLNALKDMGITVASSGAMLAVKQLMGHVIYETYDVFFDEISTFHQSGLPFESEAYTKYFEVRKDVFSDKLRTRIHERKIMERSREIGIQSFVSGMVAAIPQLMISLIMKLPALVMGVIRECTSGVIKSLRVLLSKVEDKIGKVLTILTATIGSVLGLYLMRLVSNGLSTIPLLSIFSNELSSIFTGSLIGLVSLLGIYVFNQNKHKISFSFKLPKKAQEETTNQGEDPLPA